MVDMSPFAIRPSTHWEFFAQEQIWSCRWKKFSHQTRPSAIDPVVVFLLQHCFWLSVTLSRVAILNRTHFVSLEICRSLVVVNSEENRTSTKCSIVTVESVVITVLLQEYPRDWRCYFNTSGSWPYYLNGAVMRMVWPPLNGPTRIRIVRPVVDRKSIVTQLRGYGS